MLNVMKSEAWVTKNLVEMAKSSATVRTRLKTEAQCKKEGDVYVCTVEMEVPGGGKERIVLKYDENMIEETRKDLLWRKIFNDIDEKAFELQLGI